MTIPADGLVRGKNVGKLFRPDILPFRGSEVGTKQRRGMIHVMERANRLAAEHAALAFIPFRNDVPHQAVLRIRFHLLQAVLPAVLAFRPPRALAQTHGRLGEERANASFSRGNLDRRSFLGLWARKLRRSKLPREKLALARSSPSLPCVCASARGGLNARTAGRTACNKWKRIRRTAWCGTSFRNGMKARAACSAASRLARSITWIMPRRCLVPTSEPRNGSMSGRKSFPTFLPRTSPSAGTVMSRRASAAYIRN